MIRISSFISSFKYKVEKNIKKLGSVLSVGLTLIAIVVVCKFLNYIYVSPEYFSRILFHTFYEEEDNIDNLYLGSSHVYNGINPYKLDELNNQNNFILGTSAQLLNSSYHLLIEADKNHEIKQVYLEMYYACSTGDSYTSRIWNNWRVTDFMKPSWNKLQLMFSLNDSENALETVFPFIRYRSKLFDKKHIMNNIHEKQREDYKKYQHVSEYNFGTEIFYGKGFCMRDWAIEENELLMSGSSMQEKPMLKEAETYLRKIIEYCNDRGIEIILYSAPMYELQLLSVDNYDAYVEQVNSIAQEYGIPYYDFNLCKEDVLPIQETKYFYDIGHLNFEGTELFTDVFWQIVQMSPEDNSTLFYKSYSEKREKTEGRVYGIVEILGEEAVDEMRHFKVASNYQSGMEYRIFLTPNEGESIMIQDFSLNASFSAPTDEEGICTIVARSQEKMDKVQTIEIEY